MESTTKLHMAKFRSTIEIIRAWKVFEQVAPDEPTRTCHSNRIGGDALV